MFVKLTLEDGRLRQSKISALNQDPVFHLIGPFIFYRLPRVRKVRDRAASGEQKLD